MICKTDKYTKMKIAIVPRPDSFSERWIEYCDKNGIEYKLVNPYASDIMQQIAGCDAFMWHHIHGERRNVLFAKQLLFSIQTKGLKVFPDFNTGWHFDDKVGEKYLLEAVGAPLVPSYVFYTKKEAMDWIASTTFPKVFKLRGGAGASNVKLARTAKEATRLVNKAFGRGFPHFDRWNYCTDRFNKWRHGHDTFIGAIKGFGRLFITPEGARNRNPEKGYAYFQDFIPENKFDIRVCVVDNKAFALKRMAREGDFRASGSGNIIYDKNQIDERCVKIALDISQKLGTQSMAYDFVFDNGNPLIVETSYCYSMGAYDYCEGYWTSDMQWHEGTHFDFCGWMVENVINS